MPIKFYTPKFYVLNNFSAHAIEFRGKLYPLLNMPTKLLNAPTLAARRRFAMPGAYRPTCPDNLSNPGRAIDEATAIH